MLPNRNNSPFTGKLLRFFSTFVSNRSLLRYCNLKEL